MPYCRIIRIAAVTFLLGLAFGCAKNISSIPKDRVYYVNEELLARDIHLSAFADTQIGIKAFSSNLYEFEAVIKKGKESETVRYKHPLGYRGVNRLERSTARIFSKVVVQNPNFQKYKLVKRVYLDKNTDPVLEEVVLTTMIDYLEMEIECPVHQKRLVRMTIELVRLPEMKSLFGRELKFGSLEYIIK